MNVLWFSYLAKTINIYYYDVTGFFCLYSKLQIFIAMKSRNNIKIYYGFAVT